MIKNLINISILLIFGYSTLILSNLEKFLILSNPDILTANILTALLLLPNAFWIVSIFLVIYALQEPLKSAEPLLYYSKFLKFDLDIYQQIIPEISSNYIRSVFGIKNTICLYSYSWILVGICISFMSLLIVRTSFGLIDVFIFSEFILFWIFLYKSIKSILKVRGDYEKAFDKLEKHLNDLDNLVSRYSRQIKDKTSLEREILHS